MKAIKNYVLLALMFVTISVTAQNDAFGDDVYFSSKDNKVEPPKKEVVNANTPSSSSSVVVAATVSNDRDVDEYNRRYLSDDTSSYVDEPVNDSIANDQNNTTDDGGVTQRIVKFHDPSKIIIVGADNVNVSYDNNSNTYQLDFDQPASSGLSINLNSGYGWNNPCYYGYPYYGGGWNSWYYGGWYSPWYTSWYSPWFYGGWNSPWYYGGWYGPGYWGWSYPFYGGWYGGGGYYYGSNKGSYYSNGRQSNLVGSRSSSAANYSAARSSYGNSRSSAISTTTREGSSSVNTYTRQSSSNNGAVSSDTRTRTTTNTNSRSSYEYSAPTRTENSSGNYSTRSSSYSSGSYSSGGGSRGGGGFSGGGGRSGGGGGGRR